MGNQVTVNILMDAFDQLRRYPVEFVDSIGKLLNRGGITGVGNHVNCLTISRAEHADTPIVYIAHRNSFFALSPWDPETRRFAENCPNLMREFFETAQQEIKSFERFLEQDSQDS